jgi:6-hydroxynicotinate 3-monooxygenase
VLARCLDAFGAVEEAFDRYAALRRERTARIQLTSGRNEWLSQRTDPDWVYGYDALAVALADGG